MRATRISRCEGRNIPWANGLGTSREIFLAESESQQGAPTFLWRLATTRIERDCPFSAYPGQDRTIVMTRGNGFDLIHDSGKTQTVTAPFGAILFGGDWGTRCRLLDGPVEVLNLMASRRHITCSLTPVALRAERLVQEVYAGTKALYVLDGDVSARLEGDAEVTLEQGDTLRLALDAPSYLALRARESPADLLLLHADFLARTP